MIIQLELSTLALLLLAAPASAAAARGKPDCSAFGDVISCSSSSKGVDTCCVPSAGRFVLRQRFDPDGGNDGTWGVEGVDVLEYAAELVRRDADSRCDGSPATKGGRKRSHEEIGSLCARAKGFDVEENEGAWAQSEVGEGVEEVWERAVSRRE